MSNHRWTPGQEGLPKAPRANLPWRPPRRPSDILPPSPGPGPRHTHTHTCTHLSPCPDRDPRGCDPDLCSKNSWEALNASLHAALRAEGQWACPQGTRPQIQQWCGGQCTPGLGGPRGLRRGPSGALRRRAGRGGDRKGPGAGSGAAPTPSHVCRGRCTSWASVPALGPQSGVASPPQLVGASLRSQSWNSPTGARPTGPAAPWAGLSDPSGLSHPLTWGWGESSPEPRRLPRPGATREDKGRRSEWRWGQSLGPHPGGQRLPAERMGTEPRLCGRFCDDIAWMTGRRPGFYWRATWKVVSPLLLLTICVAYVALLASSPPRYKAWNPRYVSPLGRGMTPGPKTQPHPPPRCPPGTSVRWGPRGLLFPWDPRSLALDVPWGIGADSGSPSDLGLTLGAGLGQRREGSAGSTLW